MPDLSHLSLIWLTCLICPPTRLIPCPRPGVSLPGVPVRSPYLQARGRAALGLSHPSPIWLTCLICLPIRLIPCPRCCVSLPICTTRPICLPILSGMRWPPHVPLGLTTPPDTTTAPLRGNTVRLSKKMTCEAS